MRIMHNRAITVLLALVVVLGVGAGIAPPPQDVAAAPQPAVSAPQPAVSAPRPARSAAPQPAVWAPRHTRSAAQQPAVSAPRHARSVAPQPGVSAPRHARSAAQQQGLQSLLEQARSANRAYRYEQALAALEQAVAIDPLHVEANMMLRTAHSRLGSLEAVAGRFRLLREQYPDSAVPYYLLGATNLGGPNGREMQRAYLLEALRIDPTLADAAATLATLSMNARDYARAEEWARRAMELDPGPDSTMRFASLLERQGRNVEAMALLKQVVAQHPQHLAAWIRLWTAQLDAQYDRQAGRQRDITPLLPEIDANRFRFMNTMEDMERLASLLARGGVTGRVQAADLWLAIAERYPEHPRAEVALVRAASYVDADTGIEILRRLLETYPESQLRYTAYERMITALMREDRTDEAVALSREVIDLPDPGFRDVGAARATVGRTNVYGRSFVCIGHVGWFMATQSPVAPIGMSFGMVVEGRLYPQVFFGPRADTPISPAAAAAAQSLLESACREPGVLMVPGSLLAQNPSYRELGLSLLERALAIHEGDVATGVLSSDDAARLESTVDRLRGDLAGYYLDAGRLDDAVALIDDVVGRADGRMSNVDRVAARVYEAAGRLEDAKVHYLRVASSRSTNSAAADALERIYRALASNELETFDPASAPRLPARVRLRRPPPLEIDVPLGRALDAELTLVVVWSPSFPPSRVHLQALVDLGEAFAEAGVGTLSIAVARSGSTVTRELDRVPAPQEPMRGSFNELAALGIEELPTTLLVDAGGRVLARQMSYGGARGGWTGLWQGLIAEILEGR